MTQESSNILQRLFYFGKTFILLIEKTCQESQGIKVPLDEMFNVKVKFAGSRYHITHWALLKDPLSRAPNQILKIKDPLIYLNRLLVEMSLLCKSL